MNIRTLRKYLKIHKLNIVSFTDKKKHQTDCTEIYPHFQQNKKKTNDRQIIRNQPPYPDDEEYFCRKQQQYNTNRRKNQRSDIDQPDDFFHQIT